MAGHSKFSNIKHRKGAQDKRRAKQFARLTREIMTAATQNGTDTTSNPRLRTAIQNARAANMPKDNIQRAISKSSEKNAAQYQEIRYEGFAPSGIGLIIETLSDNRNRSASHIRSTLTKYGGNLGETNSVAFMFSHKGELFYRKQALSDEEALQIAIESNLDEYHSTKDGHFFFCPKDAIDQTARMLETNTKTPPDSQRLAWLAKTKVEPDESSLEGLRKITEALEELDDVRYIFTNASIKGDPLFYAPL